MKRDLKFDECPECGGHNLETETDAPEGMVDVQECDAVTFLEYLEQQGFQADACESTTHPDFFALAERLWEENQGKGRLIAAQQKLRDVIQAQEMKLGQALEEIVAAHSLLRPETYHEFSLQTALRALGRG